MLEDILSHPEIAKYDAKETPLVLAMLFLQPGKHAGAGGDVDQLVEEAQKNLEEKEQEKEQQRRSVLKTGLLAPHPVLIELLADRVAMAFPVAMMPRI
jgi:hypothetical protein